jgi:hypothetical protein
MSTVFTPRAPSVLQSRRNSAEAQRPAQCGIAALQARAFQVLQSSRAPAQLNLFLRPGAIDVK